MYTIYTDGAYSSSTNCGGASAIIIHEGTIVKKLYQGYKNTTNNRMELMAIWNALNLAEYGTRNVKGPIIINIYSDSAYCVNIFTQWIKGWISRGWKKADKKPIENVIYNQSEADIIIKYIKDSKNLNDIAIQFAIYTGMRVGEIVALR